MSEVAVVEPEVDARRPTRMSPRLVASMFLVAVGIAACGNAGEGSGTPTRPATVSAATCASTPKGRAVTKLGSFDLDGDGHAESVMVTPPNGFCANMLVTKVNGSWISTGLGEVSLDPAQVQGIRLPGHDGIVILAKQFHPRGGFAVHLYGYAGGKLAELLVSGQPIFEFVATDTHPAPLSATCTRAGFEVTRGRVDQRTSWTLTRTTYTVSGNRVVAGATALVQRSVTNRQLSTRYPDLVHHALFENCSH